MVYSDPQYYKQEKPFTCSIAVLRMVLAHYSIIKSESELCRMIEKDYGKGFRNVWNPTIAKLAAQFGIDTQLHALWPLLQKDIFSQALAEFQDNPETFDVRKYENPLDEDKSTEPLPLAYKEMFLAVKAGCTVHYGGLTANKLLKFLRKGYLVQTSIKVERMYPEKNKVAFHSLLVFNTEGAQVHYHDPAYGENLTCSVTHLLKAANGVGAFMVYKGLQ